MGHDVVLPPGSESLIEATVAAVITREARDLESSRG